MSVSEETNTVDVYNEDEQAFEVRLEVQSSGLNIDKFGDEYSISWSTTTTLNDLVNDFVNEDNNINSGSRTEVSFPPTNEKDRERYTDSFESVNKDDRFPHSCDFFAIRAELGNEEFYEINWVKDAYPAQEASNKVSMVSNRYSITPLEKYFQTVEADEEGEGFLDRAKYYIEEHSWEG